MSEYKKKLGSQQYTVPVGHSKIVEPVSDFVEKVVQIDRVTRTVKGGHRMKFRALVVVGDKNGKIGFGIGKSNEISSAVTKAVTIAKRTIKKIIIVNNTIPFAIDYKDGAAHIMLKPAKEGTSVIAGGSVRSVIEAVGIKNILTKVIGTSNKAANVRATINALVKISNKGNKDF